MVRAHRPAARSEQGRLEGISDISWRVGVYVWRRPASESAELSSEVRLSPPSLLTFHPPPAFSMSKTILDVDVGVDDALALLLAFTSPELDIVSITPSFGNTSLDHVSANLTKLFWVLENDPTIGEGTFPVLDRVRAPGGRPIKVASKGAQGPMEGELEMAEYFVRIVLLCPLLSATR